MKKPYATDWETVTEGVQYSKELHRWWSNGTIYDELSANHNGLIGPGALLKSLLKGR